MDNILSLAEQRRRDAKPYKSIITVVALITIVETLEIWACGWPLITLLSPEDYGNIWEGKNGSTPFHEIRSRHGYTYCIISFLAFHLVYVAPVLLLIWGNRGNKVVSFIVFSITSSAALLLSVAVTIYFLTQDYDKAFLIISAPGDPAALPHFLLFLYFSRYFFLGWVLKVAFILCAGMRRREIEEDKDVDIQAAVDIAFKSVFEQEHDVDSVKDDHKAHLEQEDDHVHPESIPENIHRIPRAKVVNAQQQSTDHDVDAVTKARQAAAVNGYLNQGFEHDVEPRLPTHAQANRDYVNTRPSPRADQDKHTDTRSRHIEEGHRRDPSQDARQSRDSTLALRPASHYELQNRAVPELYDQRRREEHSQKAYPRKDLPRESAYQSSNSAAQIAYEAKRRSPEYQEYTPGDKGPRHPDYGRPLSRTDPRRQDSGSGVVGGESPQDYSPRDQSPPVQYANRRPDYPGTRPQQRDQAPHGQDNRRNLEEVQSPQRGPRREPKDFEYDTRSRGQQDSPPVRDVYRGVPDFETRSQPGDARGLRREAGRDFEMREPHPGRYPGRDNARDASPQGYDSDPGSSRPDEFRRQRSGSPQPLNPAHYLRNGTSNSKPRPVSAYNARDSGRFDYGPGPLGYEVPSPHQRPRSLFTDEEEPRFGGSASLRREESIVRKISHRYDPNIGGGLRTGPPPVGGVPAIGPASIRRVPPRNMQY
ncbi:unnamed protein product [Ixodes hexagonus]